MKHEKRKYKSIITCTPCDIGESLEEKLRNAIAGNQSLDLGRGKELIFTERKDGVLAAYDIRTDRFAIALAARDRFAKSEQAKRAEQAPKGEKNNEQKDAG